MQKEDDTNKDRQPRYDIDHIYLYYHIIKGLGMMWGMMRGSCGPDVGAHMGPTWDPHGDPGAK